MLRLPCIVILGFLNLGSHSHRFMKPRARFILRGLRETFGLYRDCPEPKAASHSISGGQFSIEPFQVGRPPVAWFKRGFRNVHSVVESEARVFDRIPSVSVGTVDRNLEATTLLA
jgi:hypothetical protein